MKLRCENCGIEIKSGDRIGFDIIGDSIGIAIEDGPNRWAIKIDDNTPAEIWCINCNHFMGYNFMVISAKLKIEGGE